MWSDIIDFIKTDNREQSSFHFTVQFGPDDQGGTDKPIVLTPDERSRVLIDHANFWTMADLAKVNSSVLPGGR